MEAICLKVAQPKERKPGRDVLEAQLKGLTAGQ
jgi:hypothetical protein